MSSSLSEIPKAEVNLEEEPVPADLPATPYDAPLETTNDDMDQSQNQKDLVVMMPETIVSIRPIRINAKATRKRLQATTKDEHTGKDAFEPRQSRLAQRAFDSCLTSDDDIWVERFYYNKAKHRVYFYRSFKTGKCVLSEPPSGAHCIVYMRDLDRAPRHIQQFALERLEKEIYLNCMEKSRPTLPPPTILRSKPQLKKPPLKRRHGKAPRPLAMKHVKTEQ